MTTIQIKEIVRSAKMRVENSLDRMSKGVTISHINMNDGCDERIAFAALREAKHQECFQHVTIKEAKYNRFFNQLELLVVIK